MFCSYHAIPLYTFKVARASGSICDNDRSDIFVVAYPLFSAMLLTSYVVVCKDSKMNYN